MQVTISSSQTESSLNESNANSFLIQVSLVGRAKEPFLSAGMGQKHFVPMATWDSFLEDVGMELNCGFINVSGLHGNPRNLVSHDAPRFYSVYVGEGRSLPQNIINKGTRNKTEPLRIAVVAT